MTTEKGEADGREHIGPQGWPCGHRSVSMVHAPMDRSEHTMKALAPNGKILDCGCYEFNETRNLQHNLPYGRAIQSDYSQFHEAVV
jgi:hypothetical protein